MGTNRDNLSHKKNISPDISPSSASSALDELDLAILRFLEHNGRATNYEVGEAVGLSGSAWYRKLHRRGSTFTLEEFGSIAEALDAPEGWPFVEWRA